MVDRDPKHPMDAAKFIIEYASLNIRLEPQIKEIYIIEESINKVVLETQVTRDIALEVLKKFRMNIKHTILYLTI